MSLLSGSLTTAPNLQKTLLHKKQKTQKSPHSYRLMPGFIYSPLTPDAPPLKDGHYVRGGGDLFFCYNNLCNQPLEGYPHTNIYDKRIRPGRRQKIMPNICAHLICMCTCVFNKCVRISCIFYVLV